jgi:hypothetical protein
MPLRSLVSLLVSPFLPLLSLEVVLDVEVDVEVVTLGFSAARIVSSWSEALDVVAAVRCSSRDATSLLLLFDVT